MSFDVDLIVSYLYLIGRKRPNKPGPKRQVPLFAEFLLVLVRLRLGLVGSLADIYLLSKGSVSKIFTTWINMLYHVFKDTLIVFFKFNHLHEKFVICAIDDKVTPFVCSKKHLMA